MIRTSITLVALLVILGIASAHSNLGYPLAYSKRSCKASESHTCDGACPPLNGNARNSPQNPADTWRRGQEVEIIWHKNNHIKGFYRRSLVPIKLMKEHKWHKLTAFDYGCWSQGTFRCGNSDKCGGDKTGKAYKNKITVPSVFPDGIYVFSQVWYGGLHWRGAYPKYSDYYSCSIIRIRGGAPLQKMAEATWTGPEKKCATGSTRPLQCGGESCGDRCGLEKCPRSSVQITVPDEFKNGAVPKVVLANIAPGAVGSASGEPTESDTNTAVTTPVTDAETAGEKLAPEEKKDSTEDTAQERSLTTKKNSQGDGPLKSVRVFLNNKMVRELSDGEVATIALNGKTVAFEGWTGGKQAGTMRFKVNGVIDKKIERVPPYAFKGNKGRDLNGWPASEVILNKPFTFEIELENGSNRYSKKVTMTLTN